MVHGGFRNRGSPSHITPALRSWGSFSCAVRMCRLANEVEEGYLGKPGPRVGGSGFAAPELFESLPFVFELQPF